MEQELYLRASEAIVAADEEMAIAVVDEAHKMNIDLLELLLQGFGSGNEEVGAQFEQGTLSLPELIFTADVMKNVTDYILDILGKEGRERQQLQPSKGKVILATVKGDIHDIGKGIVASAMRAAGFEVIDLGCEVPVETIIDEAIKHNVDIIGTSALLTSTMTEQKILEKQLADRGLKTKFLTMVGGAPCTPRWAKRIGASGYSEDASDAVRIALELMKGKNNE